MTVSNPKCVCDNERSFAALVHVSDDICSVLLFLESSEGHFGSRYIFLWVFQVFKERVVAPCDPFLDVCSGVAVFLCLSCLSAEDSP